MWRVFIYSQKSAGKKTHLRSNLAGAGLILIYVPMLIVPAESWKQALLLFSRVASLIGNFKGDRNYHAYAISEAIVHIITQSKNCQGVRLPY